MSVDNDKEEPPLLGIAKTIKILKSNQSPGLDDILTQLLKLCGNKTNVKIAQQ